MKGHVQTLGRDHSGPYVKAGSTAAGLMPAPLLLSVLSVLSLLALITYACTQVGFYNAQDLFDSNMTSALILYGVKLLLRLWSVLARERETDRT